MKDVEAIADQIYTDFSGQLKTRVRVGINGYFVAMSHEQAKRIHSLLGALLQDLESR